MQHDKMRRLEQEHARYPPVDRDEVYKKMFEQAENFKRCAR